MTYTLKSTVLFITFIGFMANLYGQNCTNEGIIDQPGNWKAGMGGYISKSPANEQARAKKITDALYQMLVKNYSPRGLEAIYSSTKPDPVTAKSYRSAAYYFSIYFMHYYCQGGQRKTVHETSSTVTINANYPCIFFTNNVTDEYIGENFERENYGWLNERPILENGVWNLGSTETKNGFGQMIRNSKWIVAYNDVPPFLYVSRKEYLQKLRAKLVLGKAANEKSLRDPSTLRSRAEQESDKNRIVAANSTTESGRKWVKDKFLKEYKTDEERMEENVIRSNGNYDKRIALLDENLSKSEKILTQDAIISLATEFKGFVNDDDRHKAYVIKENPDYYNNKLPVTTPQLFGIEFKLEYKNPILQHAYADVMKAIDFSALKNMLGKEPALSQNTPVAKPAGTSGKKSK